MPSRLELRPTIDRDWLERAAVDEPLVHAYALWDLDRAPGAVRFVSAVRDGATVGYLLFWLGGADRPVVHWFESEPLADALAPSLPSPPFVAVVPPGVVRAVAPAGVSARVSPLRLMVRHVGETPRPAGAPVRRLGRDDRASVLDLVRRGGEPELAGYVGLDLESERVWGAFDRERLVGVARATVRLPRIWVVGGVFVQPSNRGRGLATALVTSVVADAAQAGAPAGLYVREEPLTAGHVYERLGFREVGRRTWVDVGRPAPGGGS